MMLLGVVLLIGDSEKPWGMRFGLTSMSSLDWSTNFESQIFHNFPSMFSVDSIDWFKGKITGNSHNS